MFVNGQYHAVRVAEIAVGGLFEAEGGDLLPRGMAKVLAYIYIIIGVAVVEHTAGDGCGGVIAIGEDTNLWGAFYQCLVELVPGAACQRHDAHVVIGQQQAVSQHLQRVEGGTHLYLCLRHPAADGAGEAEEERVAAGEYDDGAWSVESGE